jgi:hypothetical protein
MRRRMLLGVTLGLAMSATATWSAHDSSSPQATARGGRLVSFFHGTITKCDGTGVLTRVISTRAARQIALLGATSEAGAGSRTGVQCWFGAAPSPFDPVDSADKTAKVVAMVGSLGGFGFSGFNSSTVIPVAGPFFRCQVFDAAPCVNPGTLTVTLKVWLSD